MKQSKSPSLEAAQITIPHNIRSRLVYLRLLKDEILEGEIPDPSEWTALANALNDIDSFFQSIDSQKELNIESSQINFANIKDEFNFFQKYSNEAEIAISDISPIVSSFSKKTNHHLKILDFGCGDGKTLAQILRNVGRSPFLTELNFVDINTEELQNAEKANKDFTCFPIRTEENLKEIKQKYSIIFAIQVLYYVKNLKETLLSLIERLEKNSICLITIANKQNELFALNQSICEVGQIPFSKYWSEDIEDTLTQLRIPFKKHTMISELSFHDTVENRAKLILFINTGKSHNFKKSSELLKLLDRYKCGDKIVLVLKDDLYTITK